MDGAAATIAAAAHAPDIVHRLVVRHCRLPVRRARDHGSGRVAGGVEVVVLELSTRDGVTGWGEASPWAVFTGTAEAQAAALTRYLAPFVLGRRPSDLAAIMADADRALVGHGEAKAALETALLDALGKAAGLPVHALLGGAARTAVPLSVSLADPEFEADLDLVARLREDGVGIVKLKTGVRDHAFDLSRIERLKRDHPDLDVRADYNQGLRPEEAMRRCRDLDGLGLGFVEQPVAARHFALMAEIAAALDTPILADESVFTATDMLRAVEGRIADGVSIKIMKSGGLRAAHAIASIAGAAGMAAYGGDMFETGIAHLAGLHMVAAHPDITLGAEFYQSRYHLEADLLAAPIPLVAGALQVPTAPGLGIDVDRNRLKSVTLTETVATP